MTEQAVRPFDAADAEQLTVLVNAHVGAVLPGGAVPVAAVLAQLEREPGEYVVDPWAIERATFVAEVRGRVSAAAHAVRYAGEADYRDAGEIRWLVAWPEAADAADAVARACLARLDAWGVAARYAGGALPAPGLAGVPDAWPHVAAAYERAGFAPDGRREIAWLAPVDRLPRGHDPPVRGLTVRRELGGHATRFVAELDGEPAAFAEVQADLSEGGARPRFAGWAELWELEVSPELRRRRVGTWLMGEVAEWLRLGAADRLLDVTVEGEHDEAFQRWLGYRELARARRGWRLSPG
jgi:GNAT superfamily N-acetyltransferase